MKKVTLRVNGSLYIGNNLPEVENASAMVEGMECVEGSIKLDALCLDKDIELHGDVFVNDIFIPERVKVEILCAGGLVCGYNEITNK